MLRSRKKPSLLALSALGTKLSEFVLAARQLPSVINFLSVLLFSVSIKPNQASLARSL